MSKFRQGFSRTETNHRFASATSRRVLSMMGAVAIAVVGIFVAAPISAVKAQDLKETNPAVELPDAKFAAPVYDKQNGSYYEMVGFQGDGEGTWGEAAQAVDGRTYKGRQGRMAVVKDRATNTFLLRNFGYKMASEAWFGLAYHCDSRQLIWSDGTVFKPGDFSNWNNQWYRSYDETCDFGAVEFVDRRLMPVYYMTTNHGFTWQATGEEKVFSNIFVEYPAPEADKNKTSGKDSKETTASAK